MKKIALTMTLTFLILTTSLSILIQTKNVRASNNNILEKMRPANKLTSLFNFLDNMKPGDIIIHLPGKESQYGHCRLFTGFDSENSYSFVDSYFHVLGYSRTKIRAANLFLFLTYFWGYDGLVLVRVNASEEQIKNAIDFAKLQVGKRFDFCREGIAKNFNPEDTTDPTANLWYCSELPWAAYYNCNNSFPKEKPKDGYIYGEGIDIDANGWEKDREAPNGVIHSLVYPLDIINDDDVKIIDVWMRQNREFNGPNNFS